MSRLQEYFGENFADEFHRKTKVYIREPARVFTVKLRVLISTTHYFGQLGNINFYVAANRYNSKSFPSVISIVIVFSLFTYVGTKNMYPDAI